MREVIEKKIEHEVLSFIPNISYACVTSWYGATMCDLKLDLIAPKQREGHKKCPLIVWICGGGYRVVDRSVWLPELMYFARNGYIVASIEYRTSNETVFPYPLMDGKAAIRYLKAHADDFCIDMDRICVMGESAGGTMACLLGLTADQRELEQGDFLAFDSSVHAVVDFYGIVDLTQEIACAVSDDLPPWTMQDYLGVSYSKDIARKASAISYVTKDAPPFLILHGENDDIVPISQSEAFHQKLQNEGVDSVFYVLKDAGHGDDGFYQDYVLDRITQFLERVLRLN